MASIISQLGLSTSNTPIAAPSYGPHFIIANFILAYVLGSTRGAKVRLGIDHNVNPREDLSKYGPIAVKNGKMTEAQLTKLHRQEAAHANAVEHFPFFVGAVIMAMQAGLPNDMINRYSVIYTVVRVIYLLVYAQITDKNLSYIRSGLWWASNIACMRLLWFAGKAMNKTI